MSPRAAWRLEDLGFPDVAHYGGGVADWMASGLPIGGTMADELHVAAVARPDVPTCGPRDTIEDVRERLRGSVWDTCMVVNEHRIVLGRLFPTDLREADPGAPAEEAMRPGPVTFRPDVPADQLLDQMEKGELDTAPITTSEGALVGMALRKDLARAVSRDRHARAPGKVT